MCQELGVILGTDKTGSLQFTVADSLLEAEQAARELQVLYTATMADPSICELFPHCGDKLRQGALYRRNIKARETCRPWRT